MPKNRTVREILESLYPTNTGSGKRRIDQALKEIEDYYKEERDKLQRLRNIEQGAWEETKKYQDENIALKKQIAKLNKPKLSISEIEEIIRKYATSRLSKKPFIISKDLATAIHKEMEGKC